MGATPPSSLRELGRRRPKYTNEKEREVTIFCEYVNRSGLHSAAITDPKSKRKRKQKIKVDMQ